MPRSITSYAKIPMLHFFDKVNNGQLVKIGKMVNANY